MIVRVISLCQLKFNAPKCQIATGKRMCNKKTKSYFLSKEILVTDEGKMERKSLTKGTLTFSQLLHFCAKKKREKDIHSNDLIWLT